MGSLSGVCRWDILFWEVVRMIDDLLVRLMDDLSDVFAAIFAMDGFDFGNISEDFGNGGLGENISLVDLDHSSKRGEQIVKEWYKEINNYNYSKPGWKRGAYRFSQLLWKSTTEIGVGVAKIPGQENKAYVVVNYRPAGNNNMPGEFERNVLPPQKLTANANLAGKNINRR